MTREYLLQSQIDSRQSFYGKARVLKEDNGDLTLISYTTEVVHIKNGKPIVNGYYSGTTTRHIKEFLQQEGFGVGAWTGRELYKEFKEKGASE